MFAYNNRTMQDYNIAFTYRGVKVKVFKVVLNKDTDKTLSQFLLYTTNSQTSVSTLLVQIKPFTVQTQQTRRHLCPYSSTNLLCYKCIIDTESLPVPNIMYGTKMAHKTRD